MKKFKEVKGITLIALVITIIVLLILAGISISMIGGQDGILNKAVQAKEDAERAEIIDNARLEIINEVMKTKNNGKVPLSQLKKIMSKCGKVTGSGNSMIVTTETGKTISVTEFYDGEIIDDSVTFTLFGKTYNVDKDTTWHDFMWTEENESLFNNANIEDNLDGQIFSAGGQIIEEETGETIYQNQIIKPGTYITDMSGLQ